MCLVVAHNPVPVVFDMAAVSRSVFAALPAGEKCGLASVYQGLLEAGHLASYEVHERFHEIGSPEGLRDATAFLGTRRQSS